MYALADSISRLRRTLRRGTRVANPANKLAVAQLELLAAQIEHTGIRPGQLAQLLHMQPNTVTTIVSALDTEGMVSRIPAEGDCRAIELTVTDAGRRAVFEWQSVNAVMIDAAISTLPALQRRALVTAVPSLIGMAAAIDKLADDKSIEAPEDGGS